MAKPVNRRLSRFRPVTVSGMKARASAAAPRKIRKTSKTSTVGCGRYWANSPAMSGPRAPAPLFTVVATIDSHREAEAWTISLSAAVAAPVIRLDRAPASPPGNPGFPSSPTPNACA